MSLLPTESGLPQEPVLEAPAQKPNARLWALTREIIETIILTVVIYAVVNFATGRFRVEGESMLPTLHPNEYVLIDKISYMLGSPERGDIVVFHYPLGTERDFIKRVIGLPSETVAIANGVITITRTDGQQEILQEPYIASQPHYQGTWTLKADEFFVLGDNRNNSSDSHSWGALQRSYLVGRAVVVYWPLEALQWVPHHDYASASTP